MQLGSGRVCCVLPVNRGWPAPLFPVVNDIHWLNPNRCLKAGCLSTSRPWPHQQRFPCYTRRQPLDLLNFDLLQHKVPAYSGDNRDLSFKRGDPFCVSKPRTDCDSLALGLESQQANGCGTMKRLSHDDRRPDLAKYDFEIWLAFGIWSSTLIAGKQCAAKLTRISAILRSSSTGTRTRLAAR
jgi:hypothetical protein